MTEEITQAPEFPNGISIVPLDHVELKQVYGVVEADAILDSRSVESINTRVVDASKMVIKEYLSNPDQRVTITVPPIGSLPALMRTLEELSDENIDMSRIDFVYCIPHGKMGEKTMSFWKVTEIGVEELDSGVIDSPALMIEDIFDSLETYELTYQKFTKLIGIGPVGKGEGEHYKSTMQHFTNKFGSKANSPYLNLLDEFSAVDITNPGINMATIAKNYWIKSGFGMNGDTDDLLSLSPKQRAEIEVLERFCTICTYKSGQETVDIQDYKKGLMENSLIDTNSSVFQRLVDITILNNSRKSGEKNGENKVLEEKEMIQNIHSLILESISGELKIFNSKS